MGGAGEAKDLMEKMQTGMSFAETCRRMANKKMKRHPTWFKIKVHSRTGGGGVGRNAPFPWNGAGVEEVDVFIPCPVQWCNLSEARTGRVY